MRNLFIITGVLLAFGFTACSDDTKPKGDGPIVKKEGGPGVEAGPKVEGLIKPDQNVTPAVKSCQCAADADCSAITGTTKCGSKNYCVACKADGDCTKGAANTGKCFTSGLLTGYCMKCTADADCTDSFLGKTCNTTTNMCTACKVTADCVAAVYKGGCDTATGACLMCGADGDCTKGANNTGKCFTSGTTKGSCSKCTADADCTDAKLGKYCNTTTNTCFYCKTDADCPITGLKLSKCDVASGACTCGADSECTSPLKCK